MKAQHEKLKTNDSMFFFIIFISANKKDGKSIYFFSSVNS